MEKLDRRRFLKAVGGLAMTAGMGSVVAACGSTTPTQAPSPAPTMAPPVPTATEISGSLYYLTWFGQTWPDQLKAEVQEVYPKLKLNIQNSMGVSEYLQVQKSRFLAGASVMDVTSLRPESIASYVEAGYLEDLTDLINDFQDHYIGSMAACTFNGRLYCVPGTLGAIGMFYNKKMFAERGLSVPKTWAEFIAVCEAFKKAGIYAFADCGVDSWPMEQTVYQFPTQVLVNDPDIFKKVAAGTVKYTDAVWVDCFREIEAFYKAGYIDPNSPGYDTDAYTAQFLNSKVPMLNQGDYFSGRIAKMPDLDSVGVFPVPLPHTNELIVPTTVTNYFAINKASNQKAAALALIKWFADPQTGGTFFARTIGWPPGVGGTKVDNKMITLWSPMYSDYQHVPMWHTLQGAAANAELLRSLARLFLGDITPEKMAANVQAAQEEQK